MGFINFWYLIFLQGKQRRIFCHHWIGILRLEEPWCLLSKFRSEEVNCRLSCLNCRFTFQILDCLQMRWWKGEHLQFFLLERIRNVDFVLLRCLAVCSVAHDSPLFVQRVTRIIGTWQVRFPVFFIVGFITNVCYPLKCWDCLRQFKEGTWWYGWFTIVMLHSWIKNRCFLWLFSGLLQLLGRTQVEQFFIIKLLGVNRSTAAWRTWIGSVELATQFIVWAHLRTSILLILQ